MTKNTLDIVTLVDKHTGETYHASNEHGIFNASPAQKAQLERKKQAAMRFKKVENDFIEKCESILADLEIARNMDFMDKLDDEYVYVFKEHLKSLIK